MSKTKQRKDPKRYERMNFHVLCITAFIVCIVMYLDLQPTPWYARVFCSLLFLYVPYLLIKRDFSDMVKRRLMIEAIIYEEKNLEEKEKCK
jgi:Ca2+/Na+ antiporter